MATNQDKTALINAREWFHSIEIEKGLVTPGRVPRWYLLDMLKSLEFPESLEDLSVLDIGAWDGFFSFEAERRGAKRVVAYDLHPPNYYGFALAKELLESKVEYVQGSVYDLSPAVCGTFDVVFFFGVLYHLRYPLLAMDRIREVTNQYLLLESHCLDNRLVLSDGSTIPLSEIDQRLTNISLFQFYRNDELYAGDYSNWFAPNRRSIEEVLWSAGFRPEFLATWNDRVAYKAIKLPGIPEYQQQTYEGLNWIQSPDGSQSWTFPSRHTEAQPAAQTRESPATAEQGGYQYQEAPKPNDLQEQAVSLRRQLEVTEAEIQRLSEENDHLRQQLTAVEKTSSDLLAAVQTLTAHYRESEALRSDQTALVKTQEQQLKELMAQLKAVQQALEIVQHTRTFRLLRRLGRWKFMEQDPFQGSASSSPGSQPSNSTSAAPPFVDPEHLARLLGERYAGDQSLFSLWERHGFHITPVHFYSPIPKVSTLPEEIWTCPTELVGIELNEPAQLAFMDQICLPFKAEYDALPHEPTGVPYEYYFNQPMFCSVDAEVLYCMIRHNRPRRIVEVGSGFSTYIAAAAGRKNVDEGRPAELVAIEPHANEVLRQGFPGLSQLLLQPVQHVALDVFTALSANDILFIDSSHVLRLDSDVRFLLLEVLPRLQPGVLVHFHDIFLPYDYPREWVVREQRFWTEQYLLQAFLAFNDAFEVLWAGSYMHLLHSDKLQRVFASYEVTAVWPGSFWIRRRSA